MRVALLTREYPPEVYGGAGVHVEHLAPALARHVEVGVHCFGAQRQDPLAARSYQPWAAVAGPDPAAAALEAMSVDLAMSAGVGGADLVHSHTWYTNLAGHLAKLRWDIPHVATTHSLEPLRPWKREQLGAGYALSSWCERVGLLDADAVIAVSRGMRDDVLACYPQIDPDRVHVVHNGIDTREYAPDAGTDVVERLGIDVGRPSVVFVGRITRQKGLVHLLDAASSIDPSAQLVVLAGAPDSPAIAAEVRTLLERAAEREGGLVHLEAMLPRRDVVQVLSHATVLVCPSVYEPFGLVNVEAMACGTAVVAGAVGGIPEIVVDGVTGLLVRCAVDPAAPDPSASGAFATALATAINRLVADPQLAGAMGAAGRRRAVEHFSWASIAERTARLYAAVLGG